MERDVGVMLASMDDAGDAVLLLLSLLLGLDGSASVLDDLLPTGRLLDRRRLAPAPKTVAVAEEELGCCCCCC